MHELDTPAPRGGFRYHTLWFLHPLLPAAADLGSLLRSHRGRSRPGGLSTLLCTPTHGFNPWAPEHCLRPLSALLPFYWSKFNHVLGKSLTVLSWKILFFNLRRVTSLFSNVLPFMIQ